MAMDSETYAKQVAVDLSRRIAKPSVGDISAGLTRELPDRDTAVESSRRIISLQRQSGMANFESKFVHLTSTRPRDPKERMDALCAMGTVVNGAPYLTAGQLFAYCVNAPHDGIYATGNAIGKAGQRYDGRATFSTPIEMDSKYAKAYAARAVATYRELSQEQNFTPDHPFRVVIVGDPNLRQVEEVHRQFKHLRKSIPAENVEIIIIDNSPGAIEKTRRFVGQSTIRIQTHLHDARNMEAILSPLRGERGVILTEEIMDAFPCEVLQVSKGGDIYQVQYRFDEYPQVREVLVPLESNPLLSKQWQEWLKLFPEYGAFVQVLARHAYPNNRTVMNIGMLEFMSGIMNSDFHGRWIWGDYVMNFLDRRMNMNNCESPVARAIAYVHDMKVYANGGDLRLGFFERSDVTVDADFGLMRYMFALGATLNFAGTYKGFIAHSFGGQPASIDMLYELLDRVTREKYKSQEDRIKAFDSFETDYLGARSVFEVDF